MAKNAMVQSLKLEAGTVTGVFVSFVVKESDRIKHPARCLAKGAKGTKGVEGILSVLRKLRFLREK
jgi:hypothetical protein